jgi:hypothetical protein
LKKYTEQGAYSWDAPGHMGGVAYLKHPVGMEFHKFFGENIMRSDLGISTSPLGSWLDHLGPPGESERNAARIFGADWTFYVLGGSSASNQIVGHGVPQVYLSFSDSDWGKAGVFQADAQRVRHDWPGADQALQPGECAGVD